MSAFTDNKEREKGNDFVTYFTAGTSIGVQRGNPKHIEAQDSTLRAARSAPRRAPSRRPRSRRAEVDGAPTLKGTCLKDGKKAPIPVLLPDQGQVDAAVVVRPGRRVHRRHAVVIYQGTLEGGKIQLGGKTTDVGALRHRRSRRAASWCRCFRRRCRS